MGHTVESHAANALVQFIRTKLFLLDKAARVFNIITVTQLANFNHTIKLFTPILTLCKKQGPKVNKTDEEQNGCDILLDAKPSVYSQKQEPRLDLES